MPNVPHRSWLIPLLLWVGLAAACGPKNLKQRTAHGEDRIDEATELITQAEQDLQRLEATRAQERLKRARERLTHPDVELVPEGEMLRSRLEEAEARISAVREEKARRELEASAERQREAVMQAMSEVTAAVEALEAKGAGRAQVEAVLSAVARAEARLREGKALEARSADYEASARRTEQRLAQATAQAQRTRQVLDFIAGPVAARQEAEALEKKVKGEKNLEARLTLYKDAQERFRRCGEDAKKLLAQTPELEKSTIEVEGRATTPKAVASGCMTRAEALRKTVAKLEQAKAAQDKKRARQSKKG